MKLHSMKRIVPKPFKRLVRRIVNAVRAARGSLIPPSSRVFVGAGDYVQIGNEFFNHFINLCNLKPKDRVLDIGCGSGRMALPLTRFLVGDHSYEGFDIVPDGIDWCQRITARFPNFRFILADVYNKAYNPEGRQTARSYVFPYEDSSFDFVFLTSVFTHMLLEDTEHYLSEISRVLKPLGRCFATFFLLNDESRALMHARESKRDFVHEVDGVFTTSQDTPEDAVAIPETAVKSMLDRCRMRLLAPVHYGSWCGRTNYLSYQDIVVSEKLGDG